MESMTFRKWLVEQGCRFDAQHEGRGEGHGTLIIRREGRTAELSLAGPHHELDPRSVRQVCEALGLEWSDLPGPRGRV
jgi:mRNA interferase HicA